MIKYIKYFWDNWAGFCVHMLILMFIATGLTIVLFNILGIHSADKIIVITAACLYVSLIVLVVIQEE